jgi:DNA helicase-2/ATP-dependent DNA helicase PcrA
MSRFLAELPRQAVVVTGSLPGAAPAARQPQLFRARREHAHAVAAAPAAGAAPFKPGARVRHPLFGVGTVLRSDGAGDDLKLTVSFAGIGAKRLVARYAGLELL